LPHAQIYIHVISFTGETEMTMTLDHTQTATQRAHVAAKADDEPWAIWAGLMVFLTILVFSGMTYGLAGLVAVMAPAAIGMVLILCRIVTEGI
jgi:uncharacterized membrane protein YgdD (TMEM256/DUF423 family)